MSDTQPDNLMLILLRRIDQRVAEMAGDLLEIKSRLGALEQQYASVSNRVDRIESRLARIEKRLDLIGEPTS